jgi:hypothetical protein
MRFGHFDDDRREYVITRPDTPKSWSNYLGPTEYGAIITTVAGGSDLPEPLSWAVISERGAHPLPPCFTDSPGMRARLPSRH